MLVAFVVVVTQLFGLGHMLFVSHTQCEHGELVHEGDVHASHAAAAPAGDAPGDVVERGAGMEREHDHCDALALRPALISVAPSVPALTLLDGFLLPWSVRPRVESRAVALLSLAPKSSPPSLRAS